MWTQKHIDEIVAALWHLPADKLLEAKSFVLSLKKEFGYEHPVTEEGNLSEAQILAVMKAALGGMDQEKTTEMARVEKPGTEIGPTK